MVREKPLLNERRPDSEHPRLAGPTEEVAEMDYATEILPLEKKIAALRKDPADGTNMDDPWNMEMKSRFALLAMGREEMVRTEAKKRMDMACGAGDGIYTYTKEELHAEERRLWNLLYGKTNVKEGATEMLCAPYPAVDMVLLSRNPQNGKMRVLLGLRKADNQWGIFGGFRNIRRNDTTGAWGVAEHPLRAVIRELGEEAMNSGGITGMPRQEREVKRLLHSIQSRCMLFHDGPVKDKRSAIVSTAYTCMLRDDEASFLVNPPMPGDDMTEVRWYDIDEVPPNLYGDHSRLIDEAMLEQARHEKMREGHLTVLQRLGEGIYTTAQSLRYALRPRTETEELWKKRQASEKRRTEAVQSFRTAMNAPIQGWYSLLNLVRGRIGMPMGTETGDIVPAGILISRERQKLLAAFPGAATALLLTEYSPPEGEDAFRRTFAAMLRDYSEQYANLTGFSGAEALEDMSNLVYRTELAEEKKHDFFQKKSDAAVFARRHLPALLAAAGVQKVAMPDPSLPDDSPDPLLRSASFEEALQIACRMLAQSGRIPSGAGASVARVLRSKQFLVQQSILKNMESGDFFQKDVDEGLVQWEKPESVITKGVAERRLKALEIAARAAHAVWCTAVQQQALAEDDPSKRLLLAKNVLPLHPKFGSLDATVTQVFDRVMQRLRETGDTYDIEDWQAAALSAAFELYKDLKQMSESPEKADARNERRRAAGLD